MAADRPAGDVPAGEFLSHATAEGRRRDADVMQKFLAQFPEADFNKDGRLTPEEAKAYFGRMSSAQQQQAMQMVSEWLHGNGTQRIVTAVAPIAVPEHFPDPKLPPELVLSSKPGLQTCVSKLPDGREGAFGVYVPAQYDGAKPMPLIVSAHGNGGSGPEEASHWRKHADTYGFIVVAPTYRSATRWSSLQDLRERLQSDNVLLEDVMQRTLRSFNIKRSCVLHTGFSAGGITTWYLALNRPEWFTALCFRSANFHGEIFTVDHAPWRDRPIYIFWGTRDMPVILNKSEIFGVAGEGPKALEFLEKTVGATKLKKEVLEGGTHTGRNDLAAKWFMEEVVGRAGAEK
jgi:dienelactone hydrolase